MEQLFYLKRVEAVVLLLHQMTELMVVVTLGVVITAVETLAVVITAVETLAVVITAVEVMMVLILATTMIHLQELLQLIPL
mgnify:CR=1 FL=1